MIIDESLLEYPDVKYEGDEVITSSKYGYSVNAGYNGSIWVDNGIFNIYANFYYIYKVFNNLSVNNNILLKARFYAQTGTQMIFDITIEGKRYPISYDSKSIYIATANNVPGTIIAELDLSSFKEIFLLFIPRENRVKIYHDNKLIGDSVIPYAKLNDTNKIAIGENAAEFSYCHIDYYYLNNNFKKDDIYFYNHYFIQSRNDLYNLKSYNNDKKVYNVFDEELKDDENYYLEKAIHYFKDITDEITINNEKFKPINKFHKFKIIKTIFN